MRPGPRRISIRLRSPAAISVDLVSVTPRLYHSDRFVTDNSGIATWDCNFAPGNATCAVSSRSAIHLRVRQMGRPPRWPSV